ncbi:MAG: Unknown protein [uncultured Sulfurovum sp.]|uniref:Uncharacterized protein n=1 Tax=uncultured Sulfurovum sp. TaxID=269237 RepID=A0A6S6TE53_9BACT|nr:MAG: Unknown protein [uncultured Sulfurovum sp.]
MLRVIFFFLFLTLFLEAEGQDRVYCNDNSNVKSFFSKIGIDINKKGYNKSYALVVGISNYQDNSAFEKLPTKDDPIDMAKYLCQEGGFDHVRILTEEKVSISRVRELMEYYYPNKLNSNDRFLFYWSGHGEDEQLGRSYYGHLPVYNSQSNKYHTMIKMSSIRDWSNRIQTRCKQTLYLVDSCYSGLIGSVPQGNSNAKQLTLNQLAYPSHHILSAGSGRQITYAHQELGGGIFTRAILDALRTGKADKSNIKDGVISIAELQLHIKEYVRIKNDSYARNYRIKPELRHLDTNQGEFYFFVPSNSNNQIVRVSNASQAEPIAQSSQLIQQNIPQATHNFLIPKMINIQNKFEIGKYEVTIGEYKACVSAGGCNEPEWLGKGSEYNINIGSDDYYKKMCLEDNCPIMGVRWYDAKAYAKWLSEKTGKRYRLPTENEWEYVAKAGKPSEWKWSFGNDENELTKYAWYHKNSNGTTHKVGQKLANPWGVHDIYGNVWEWCEDWYSNEQRSKNIRGGSWVLNAINTRSAYRNDRNPSNRNIDMGFRILRTLP